MSIQGEIINQGRHEFDSCGYLESFPQLIASAHNRVQRKVVKVESMQELEKLSNIPTLSLVLVKMTTPYLPANPKIKLKKNVYYNVLLIAEDDWRLVRCYLLIKFKLPWALYVLYSTQISYSY